MSREVNVHHEMIDRTHLVGVQVLPRPSSSISLSNGGVRVRPAIEICKHSIMERSKAFSLNYEPNVIAFYLRSL